MATKISLGYRILICTIIAYLGQMCNPSCHTSNCQTCQNVNLCDTCCPMYFKALTFCLSCPTNCITCSSLFTCDACSDNSAMVGTCKSCISLFDPNCLQCDSNNCNSCAAGYFLTSNPTHNTCFNCTDPECQKCSKTGSKQTCLQCYQGYGVKLTSTDQCQLCTVYNANICLASNNCPVSGTCVNCPRFVLDSDKNCMRCTQKFRNCQTCTSSECVTCNDGYFMNTTNNQECLICNFAHCQQCAYENICTQCIKGYYSDSVGQCHNCIYPCLVCSSPSICLTCDPNDNRTVLSQNSSCVFCQSVLQNCTTCTMINATSYQCSSCADGYYNAVTCISCSYPCKTCINPTKCLSCEENTIYNSSTMLCNPCNSSIVNCTTCFNQLICLSCDPGFFVSRPNKCLACSQNFPNCKQCTQHICTICQSGFLYFGQECIQNRDCGLSCYGCIYGQPLNCTSCFEGYFLSNSSCIACNSTCVSCISAVMCIKCISNYFNTNGSCQPCISGYYNSFLVNCTNCTAHCLNCLDFGRCSVCQDLYEVDKQHQNYCVDKCGDSYIVQLPCDLPKGIPNDGCLDTCQLEANYNCTVNSTKPFTFSNGTTVNLTASDCSFIGNLTIIPRSAEQSLFSNTMTLVFSIQPYLYGLPTNADTQDYIKSIYSLSPFDPASYSISIDDAAQTITFQVEHSTDISDSSFSMGINFGYLSGTNTMFKFLQNTSFALTLKQVLPSGRLGQYHTENEYVASRVIYNWSVILCIVGFALLLVGSFSRELGGLEQMVVFQTIYMLLLFNNDKRNFYFEGLLGFRQSMSIQLQAQRYTLPYLTSYLSDSDSFISNFGLNLMFYFLPPLLSLLGMLFRIKNKKMPGKVDLYRSISEVFIGEILLYFSIFNLNGMVSYGYLFFISFREIQFWNTLALVISVMITIFACQNLISNPKIVGCFRIAFRYYSSERESNSKQTNCQKLLKCLSYRPYEAEFSKFYLKICVNFYYFYIAYYIAAISLIISASSIMFLIILQALMLLLVLLIKPHFNILEKGRSVLTFCLLIFATVCLKTQVNSFMFSICLLALFSCHSIYLGVIMFYSFVDQLKKRCGYRSKIVRRLFKEYNSVEKEKKEQMEREVVLNLIKRIDQENAMARFGQILQHEQQQNIPKDQYDPEDQKQMQVKVIAEQNSHLRYQNGFGFFERYGEGIDMELVASNYDNI